MGEDRCGSTNLLDKARAVCRGFCGASVSSCTPQACSHTRTPKGHLTSNSACSTHGQNICLKPVHLFTGCLTPASWASLKIYNWKISWDIEALYFLYQNGCCLFSEILLKDDSYSWIFVQRADFSLGCNVLKMIWLTWYHNSVSKYVITVRNRKQFLVETYVQHSTAFGKALKCLFEIIFMSHRFQWDWNKSQMLHLAENSGLVSQASLTTTEFSKSSGYLLSSRKNILLGIISMKKLCLLSVMSEREKHKAIICLVE